MKWNKEKKSILFSQAIIFFKTNNRHNNNKKWKFFDIFFFSVYTMIEWSLPSSLYCFGLVWVVGRHTGVLQRFFRLLLLLLFANTMMMITFILGPCCSLPLSLSLSSLNNKDNNLRKETWKFAWLALIFFHFHFFCVCFKWKAKENLQFFWPSLL